MKSSQERLNLYPEVRTSISSKSILNLAFTQEMRFSEDLTAKIN